MHLIPKLYLIVAYLNDVKELKLEAWKYSNDVKELKLKIWKWEINICQAIFLVLFNSIWWSKHTFFVNVIYNLQLPSKMSGLW